MLEDQDIKARAGGSVGLATGEMRGESVVNALWATKGNEKKMKLLQIALSYPEVVSVVNAPTGILDKGPFLTLVFRKEKERKEGKERGKAGNWDRMKRR